MKLHIGYLLPTREAVMEGRPEAEPLLKLAERAEKLGYDSVWVGDSLLARPRHEPNTLLAAVAGRTQRVRLGTAVLLPILRFWLMGKARKAPFYTPRMGPERHEMRNLLGLA